MLSGNETALLTAVAAASGAVLAGGVTAVVTYKVTQRQVKSAELVAKEQREHVVALDTEQRRQDRIFNAYVTVTKYVDYRTAVVSWKLRDMRFRTDPPEEPPKADDTIGPDSQAVASLVASAEVGVLLQEFNKDLVSYGTRLATYLQALDWVKGSGTPADQGLVEQARAADQQLWSAGQRVQTAGAELLEQMRRELGTVGELPIDTSVLPSR